jgi:hypothetical protein
MAITAIFYKSMFILAEEMVSCIQMSKKPAFFICIGFFVLPPILQCGVLE